MFEYRYRKVNIMRSLIFSIEMLLKDWRTNIFYLLIIAIVSATTFVFGNISYDKNLKAEMVTNQFGSLVPRYSEFIIMIVLGFSLFLAIYAYLYVLKNKSQELKLIKLTGSSEKKMMCFLIAQNIVLLVLGSIFGLIIGFIINPLVNYIIFSFLNLSKSIFFFDVRVCFDCFKINIFTLFITTILGIGYVHRNEIKDLSIEKSDWTKDRRMIKLPTGLHILLYCLGLVMFMTAEKYTILFGAVFYSMIGCCGASGLIRKKICMILKDFINRTEETDKIKYIAINSLIYTLKQSYLLILGLLFTSTSMMAWTVTCISEPKEFIVSLISFVFSLILLYGCVMLEFLSKFKEKKLNLLFLWKCGYTKDDIKKIIVLEIFYFFLIIFIFSLIYILLMLIRFAYLDVLSLLTAGTFLFIYVFITLGAVILTIFCVSKNYKTLIRKVEE